MGGSLIHCVLGVQARASLTGRESQEGRKEVQKYSAWQWKVLADASWQTESVPLLINLQISAYYSDQGLRVLQTDTAQTQKD